MSEVRDESVERAALIKHVGHFHIEGGPTALQLCCMKPENLSRENQVEQRPGTTVRVCRQCGRRHFTMRAEPGVILRGA